MDNQNEEVLRLSQLKLAAIAVMLQFDMERRVTQRFNPWASDIDFSFHFTDEGVVTVDISSDANPVKLKVVFRQRLGMLDWNPTELSVSDKETGIQAAIRYDLRIVGRGQWEFFSLPRHVKGMRG
ncbi:MAG: hypothetical protein HKM24_01545 [Gammaproteobacteria bacterium]|nr:hypothetical protein [Gammaproteobacteria bacterium]